MMIAKQQDSQIAFCGHRGLVTDSITDFIKHVFATGSQFDLQSSLSSILLLFGGD